MGKCKLSQVGTISSVVEMTPDNLREILFDIFPRKVPAGLDEAPNMVRELQEFWKFLQREYQLENAAACLKVLISQGQRELPFRNVFRNAFETIIW
jgi:hypothetical protein